MIIRLRSHTHSFRCEPSPGLLYSNTFPGYENYFSVNTSSWTSGIYSIKIVQNGHIYNKTICI